MFLNKYQIQSILKLDKMFCTKTAAQGLINTIKYNKISYNNGNPYNVRWQYKWRHAYYTYPKDTFEHTRVKKPEDTPQVTPLFWTTYQDVIYRVFPHLKLWYERSARIQDTFQLYVLPSISLFFYQFYELSAGFKILTFFPLAMFYVRLRDKCIDPDIKEMWLRDFIHQNEELGKLFKPETIHILDHDIEWDQGYPCETKFPEFKNKFWRFFNSDTHMCNGFFKFGDLESGATMNLKFKTMPTHGQFRYQVGQPYYYYDVRAEVSHKGEFKEIVIVDENVQLKTKRPFLILI